MKRSVGITISAIVVFLGSGLCFLFGSLCLTLLFYIRHSGLELRLGWGIFIFEAVFFWGFAAWGVTTAIALLRLKRWARISMIVFSVLLAFVGGVAMLTVFAIPMTAPPNVPQESIVAIRIGIGAFNFSLLAIGAFWLYLFNRASIKQQFEGALSAELATMGPQKPISIVVIGWWFALGGLLSLPFFLFVPLPALFLAFTLTGRAAKLYFLALTCVQLYVGIGLLKWRPLSRVVGIYYSVFIFLNGAAIFLLPGSEARFAAVMNAMPQWAKPPTSVPTPPFPLWFGLAIAVVTSLLPLWFLVTRKEAYLAVANAAPQRS